MNILDKRFKYVPAAATDIRKTFARIERERKKNAAEVQQVVTPLPTRKVR